MVIDGSAGIGLETARRARAEGADVNLTGRNPGRLDQPARELGALVTAGGAATTCPGGITVLERSPDGLLAAARVYDDVDAPVNPS